MSQTTHKVPKVIVRKTYSRRDTTEVSFCLKYMIFGFNVLFWVSSVIILALLFDTLRPFRV